MQTTVHRFHAMGSDCAVHLFMASVAEVNAVLGAAEAEVGRIEARYSRYRTDSELSRINAAAKIGQSVAVDAETAGLIAYALALFRKSDGVFDISSGVLRRVWDFSKPRLPDQAAIDALLPCIGLEKITVSDSELHFTRPGLELDLGGIGKEYAADRAAEVCLSLGARHGFVDLAGDIRVIGPQPDGAPWQIGIRDPRDPEILAARIDLHSGSLATSGDYERFIEVDGQRYCHILNPRTGWPATGLSSVTVITERCLIAGSLSTTAMLKGREGSAWLQSLGVRHVAIDDRGAASGTEPLLARR